MECMHASKVKDLLAYTEAKNYSSMLNDFWESWLTHELQDGLSADERASYLYMFKNLKEFLDGLEK